MPDLIVSSDIDTLLSSASSSAARTNLGLGAADTVEFGSMSGVIGLADSTGVVLAANSLSLVGAKLVLSDFVKEGGKTLSFYSNAAVEVRATGTAVENGTALEAAYVLAKTLTPNDAALSSTNRARLVIGDGRYDLSGDLAIDAEFVDIIGPSKFSMRDKTITSAAALMQIGGGNLSVSANDVFVSGVAMATGSSINIVGTKPLQVFENCLSAGGDGFGGGIGGVAAGSFTQCASSSGGFGGNGGTASGKFTDCVAFGGRAFGGNDGIASGVFIRCSASQGDYSFGGGGVCSGTFTECSVPATSTGDFGTYNAAFGTGITSGVFIRCAGGVAAFGADGGTFSGQLLWSTIGNTTPPLITGAGKIRMCLDSAYTELNAG